MEIVVTFGIAFLFSFVGTIPPGTLNLTIIQLGLERRISIAWRMAIAAALLEYPYAWLAIEFQDFILRSADISNNFKLVAGGVMLVLGVLSLWTSHKPSRFAHRFQSSGFRKGMLLGLLNPLAIPFWIAMTAYCKTQGWIDLSSRWEVQAYLAGVATGTLTLFMLLAYLARAVVRQFKTNAVLQKTPGVVLILLGIYSVGEYMFG